MPANGFNWPEGIFLSNGNELRPDESDPALKFLDTIRDEAHRFAITYHRELRLRSMLNSRLMDIPGIGPRRRRDLLQSFNCIQNLVKADVKDIARVPGIGMKTAKIIKEHLKTQELLNDKVLNEYQSNQDSDKSK